MKLTHIFSHASRERRLSALVERYFEAETTVAEEMELYKAFAAGRYPASLEEYAPMFRDLAATVGISSAAAAAEADTAGAEARTASVGARPLRPARRKRRLALAISAAATTAAAVAIGFVLHTSAENERLERMYGGSYVIVDGKRIDNLSEIRGEIERTIAMADHMESHAAGSAVIDQIERDALNNIADAETRERVKELISR